MRTMVLHPEGSDSMLMPDWTQVLQALDAMDGKDQTLTCLEVVNGPTLMVGGGNAGRYIVNYLVNPDTQENYVLVDSSLDGPVVEICAGGQVAEFPAQWCVQLSLAVDACEHFFRFGTMAPDQTWVKG